MPNKQLFAERFCLAIYTTLIMCKILAPLILSLLLASCQTAIDLELETAAPRLVVISSFMPNQKLYVTVTESRGLLDKQLPQHVDNATVELYQDETYLATLEYSEEKGPSLLPAYSTSSFLPEINVVYTIKVSAPGYEPVSAQSSIPARIDMLGTQISNFQLSDSGEEGRPATASYHLSLSFQDPPKERNFYHINLLQQLQHFHLPEAGDTLLGNHTLRPIFFDNRYNSNHQVAHLGGGLLLSDEGLDGQLIQYDLPIQMNFNPSEEILTKLFVELRSVSEEYYDYFSSLSRQHDSNNSSFANPVIIHDNVNGGNGVFAGFNTFRDSLTVTQQ